MFDIRKAALGAAAVVLAVAGDAQAAAYTPIYSFPDATTAANPGGGLYRDSKGALYGTTLSGGIIDVMKCPSGCGVVFKLVPPNANKPTWTRQILHKFTPAQGIYVYSSIVPGKDGKLYGAAYYGGAAQKGSIFELTPPASGNKWTFKVIYSFTAPRGTYPWGDLLIDSNGRIYVATGNGGAGNGTVLRLNPPAQSKTNWTPLILHSFAASDGVPEQNGLAMDTDGQIYGTAHGGGANNIGTIFRLTPPASGNAWTFRKLHDFAGGAGGDSPQGTPVIHNGVLYGTTYYGGKASDCMMSGCGTIFKLTLPSTPNGPATFAVIHKMDQATEGGTPYTGLTRGTDGAFYGTNYQFGNGTPTPQGTLFKLKQVPGSGWVFTVLHAFGGGAAQDGDDPSGVLLLGSDGKFYGTTQYGGANDHGMVFSYEP